MPGYKHIKSVVNALDALEVVSTSAEGLPLHVIQRALVLKKQAAHHLVRTLAHKGFLVKDQSSLRYRLGPAMEAMREREVRWSKKLLARAIPKAIKISRRTGAEVVVAQLVGGSVIARHRVPLRRSEPPEHHYGWRVAPYGSGLMFQAFMSQPLLADFRDRFPLTGFAADFWKSFDLLEEFLPLVRQAGYLAFCGGGTFRVAAAVLDPGGEVRTMLSLTNPFEQMQPGQAVQSIELIRQAAGELTADLADGRSQ